MDSMAGPCRTPAAAQLANEEDRLALAQTAARVRGPVGGRSRPPTLEEGRDADSLRVPQPCCGIGPNRQHDSDLHAHVTSVCRNKEQSQPKIWAIAWVTAVTEAAVAAAGP